MDFVSGLPRSPKSNDNIQIIVDRLTKSSHFIPIRTTDPSRLAELYVKEIVRLYGVPISIVSDRDTRFVSKFWGALQKAMGTALHFSTTFHPQTDSQSERIIRILQDMLRLCVINFKLDWETHLSLIKFFYNNSFQTSIRMAPFEALYGQKC